MSGLSWTVIVPIKRLEAAKSRLRGALTGVPHRDLVLAMTKDTVAAALACPVVGRVVVVTCDPDAAEAVTGLGADVVPDAPDAGLNPALAYAACMARPRASTGAQPGLAALAADLPALRPDDLAGALRAVDSAPVRGYVPDALGTGTVMLAAPPGVCLEPCFGPGSAAAHAASGAVALAGNWPSLRRDVDTAADLADAVGLGLGRHTAQVHRAGVVPDDGGMQGTVASFDPTGQHGSVLLDDGTPVDFPAAAFAASGLRLLRVGQRVRLETSAGGDIVKVTLFTLP